MELENKLRELLSFNSQEAKGWDNLRDKMKKQDELMDEIKVLAKAQNTLIGRTIRFPMADSYALYVITKVNKKTVRIQWLDYCDAWVDSRAGKMANLDRTYAEQQINGRDKLDEIFAQRRNTKS